MISHRNLRRGLAAGARALALGVAVLATAAPAVAAGRILDVRIGRHDEFTRIVFELDAQATHQIEQKAGATELVIKLGAGSPAREILSNSDVVQSVRLEPRGGETYARVVLRTSRVRVSELTLESPPRLVIDVRPGEPAAPMPAAAPAAKPTPPVVAKPAPPAPAVAPARPAPAVAPPPPVPLGATEDEDEDEIEEVELDELAETEILVQADTDAAADDAADAEAEVAAAAAASASPTKPAAPPAPTATARPAPTPVLPPTTTSEAPRGIADYLPKGINPLFLVGAVALLAGFLLWGLLGRRDRTAREVEAADESPANVFADRPTPAWGETGATPETAPSAAAPTIEVPPADELAAEEPAPASDLPLFTPRTEELPAIEAAEEDDMPAPLERGATPRHLSVVPVEPPPAPEPVAAAFGAAPAAPAPSFDVGSRVSDLERRIALLERKLEDAADVRERLERQVVAQTEELRVQRAAIARTQRVLRTLARPDDLPIEPAPRGSGPSGSGT